MALPTKEDLRREVLGQRAEMDDSDRRRWSGDIARHVLQLDVYQAARSVGLYVDLEGEVMTRALIEACYAAGKRVAVPVMDSAMGAYRFSWVGSETEWRSGAFACQEPVEVCWLSESDRLDLVLVPGVVFDRSGARVGFGKGIYDRLLSGVACERAVLLGLAFEFQLRERVPVEAYDRVMDQVVTELSG